jgi:hypothetical protein
MPASPRTSTRSVPPAAQERATRLLLRTLMDRRSWNPDEAADDLRAGLADDRLLRLVRARVARAMLARPTPTDVRALDTLDRALGVAARGPSYAVPRLAVEA